MARKPRETVGGEVYHVLNRAAGKACIFAKPEDYRAFLCLLTQTKQDFADLKIFAFCLMFNHWHLLLQPAKDGQLSAFMKQLCQRHSQSWNAHYKRVGQGGIYQGRFKSFPVGNRFQFLAVAAYIEQNPLRAECAARAEEWEWSSLNPEYAKLLSEWPIPRPANWVEQVNEWKNAEQLEAIRRSVRLGVSLDEGEELFKGSDPLGKGV